MPREVTYTFADFCPYVAPVLPMCPLPTIEDAVRDAIITFCDKTWFWRQWLETTIVVVEGDTEAALDLPSNTRLVGVVSVQELDDATEQTWGDFVDPATYQMSRFDYYPKILFPDGAEEDFEARVRVALKPTRAATSIPEWMFEDWADVISDGAKWWLLSMSNKPWGNSQEAPLYRDRFLVGIGMATSKVVLETINSGIRPLKQRYI